ncbi:MAG: NAD(P)/FAD-dependent oxidoreductase [Gammaproteobacteria bacterium]|nr:NAD(P)/FAD-dependent oxidoreductase [Gammaproteobacteria bacterium]MDH5801284.1 NAD(P)/FAD-dependent oxidoreductase [Gammaproteobacteria bacterium]
MTEAKRQDQQATHKVDVLIVGASLAAAAAAKRLVDAGLETLIVEKRELPRHKICSGILSPRGYRFLIENFGPLPRQALHDPTWCRGVTFHFPSMVSMSMDFFGGTTPHLHRKYSDYWAIQRSGARVMDQTSFVSLVDSGDGVSVKIRPQGGEDQWVQARFVIGADGPSSPVLRSVYPNYPKQIPWFFVGQKFHEIIECPLDEDYFHFWFHPQLGHYTWSHARDGKQIVGVGFKRGDSFHKRHEFVQQYLEDKHGVKLKPAGADHEGCAENFGPSLINRYVFGQGNVLITGQATGFLNMIGEGMSCALHSGAISGESIIEALRLNRPVQELYRKMIASEVKRTTDQWNPLKIAFAKPHEADFPKALMALSWGDRYNVLRDIWRFVVLYKEFKWGRQIAARSMERWLYGNYQDHRWL